jgi:hypothetical protein
MDAELVPQITNTVWTDTEGYFFFGSGRLPDEYKEVKKKHHDAELVPHPELEVIEAKAVCCLRLHLHVQYAIE